MFRITEDPSSGSLVQYLVKNYKNDSIVSAYSYSYTVKFIQIQWIFIFTYIYSYTYSYTVRVYCTVYEGTLWSETCWSTFKYFIILIVSTYYILCITWIIKCLIIVDARCKHEECRNFLTSWGTVSFSKTLLHVVKLVTKPSLPLFRVTTSFYSS